MLFIMLKEITNDSEQHFTNDKKREAYKKDTYVENIPDIHAVGLAKTTKEVKNLVNYAIENELKIIARGAGTGVAGSQVPIHGDELIIDVSKMNNIIDLDEETMTLT